jgi:16S rRNA (cytosine1402-N4)-methyltransferase
MTPAFEHIPVLYEETLRALNPLPGLFFLDMTLGGGGHTEGLLKATAPEGRVLATDRDSRAIRAASERLAEFEARLEVRQVCFAEAAHWIEPGSCDGVLMDLGISSPQVDHAERGFSFIKDGPLDMRMSQGEGMSAADVVNQWGEEELVRVFRQLGEEPRSGRVAQAIVRQRVVASFETTLQLARCVEGALGGRAGKHHPATRVFQALRMVVNDELGQLEKGLVSAWKVLRCGGKLATITFHSLEARMVKRFAQFWGADYEAGDAADTPALRRPRRPVMRWYPRKSIKASRQEVLRNPRARSAQLRVMEKIEDLPEGREWAWRGDS